MSITKRNLAHSVFVCLGAVALTACGGSGKQQMTDSEPVPSQAQEAIPGNTGMAPAEPASTATDSGQTEPVATSEPNATSEPVPEPDTPTVNPDLPYTLNQAVLDNAVNVQCGNSTAVFSETMLELINASRSSGRMCGNAWRAAVPALGWNNTLAEAAVVHGDDMGSNNFFSHDGSNGLSVANRADSAGYQWRAVGENIAAGQLNQAEVHQTWIDSPGHCVNIMSDSFTEVGAACVEYPDSDYGSYWVVVFGDAK